jgi:hypothetical protein
MRTQQRSGIPALAVGHERRTVESEYLAVAAEGSTLFQLRFPSECLPFQTPADGIESLPIRAVRCSAPLAARQYHPGRSSVSKVVATVVGCPVSAIISVPGPTIHQSNAVLLPNLKPMSLLDIFLTSQCELVLGIWLRRNMAKEK